MAITANDFLKARYNSVDVFSNIRKFIVPSDGDALSEIASGNMGGRTG
ncbi:Uncharacterised protein [Vibrio cholerae]|uniref:Uncharacterized protein n=1 Tax=Vibrio cholerae TaxID=666 RepID=A0A655PCL8_VIBCL|nr:Uncharacterised protein [Vibrio cholerae]CSB08023.1 Uncharacterised protein [Vibrio cholerae]CSB19104.1 Uncharacterised protein [Vibrio cholerae]CSB78631.1 Uncharacterised protein [Vibrio cholerae]CSC13828.1 Uncharacterised protein [Vibrio cholerae]